MPFKSLLRPLAVSVVLLSGCSKSLTYTVSDPYSNSSVPSTSFFTTDPARSPSYGDSVLFVQGSGRSSYLFRPVNTLQNGTFVSWPKGLTIDPVSGEIDVLQSEPGARYNVGFVNRATGDTAYRQVILAGVTYPDGIYDLGSSHTRLQPYFNADAAAPGIASSIFDADGLAANRNLVVDNQTGAIDLKASVEKGLFGAQPHNGDSREISVYYRLNDQSHLSLLKTTITVYYYYSVSDIPQAMIEACRFSREAFSKASSHPDYTEVTGGGTTAPQSTGPSSTTKTAPAPTPTPPRPPQVIIVNSGHR
ncbi:MAG TPA: hypothetical protein VMH27_21395 [Puia sp.]|nr:hypothetical protein [Puia sp.]